MRSLDLNSVSVGENKNKNSRVGKSSLIGEETEFHDVKNIKTIINFFTLPSF